MAFREEQVSVNDVINQLQRASMLNCSISPHRRLFSLAAGTIRALVLENYQLEQEVTAMTPKPDAMAPDATDSLPGVQGVPFRG